MRGSAICCELLITILETPEDGLAELHTPQPHCFKTAFPGSPNGFSSRPLRKTFARSSDLCIVQVIEGTWDRIIVQPRDAPESERQLHGGLPVGSVEGAVFCRGAGKRSSLCGAPSQCLPRVRSHQC